MVDHFDGLERVVRLLRHEVFIVGEPRANARQLAPIDLFELLRRERDAFGFPRLAHHVVFEVRAPAAADVEHALLRRHLGVIVEHLAFLDLRFFERLLASEVGRARVVHHFVEPEAEKLVRNIVADFDLLFGRGHKRRTKQTFTSPPTGHGGRFGKGNSVP